MLRVGLGVIGFACRELMNSTHPNIGRHSGPVSYAMLLLTLFGWLVVGAAHAASSWRVGLSGEGGVPGGWVQVRENAIQGTRLDIHHGLGVQQMQTLRLLAWRPLSDVSQLHVGFATSNLDGEATTGVPVTFNGTPVAPGRLGAVTHFQDFIAFDASYWRRLFDFGDGGRLWGSVGATYVMLNFRVAGAIAADSVGHELKEDFYVQELPIPTLGLHLRYPLTAALKLTADVTASHLPWVNSLRTEGGEVRLAQTDEEEKLGLGYQLDQHWQMAVYAFHSYFGQDERSREDGNVIRFRSQGVGLAVDYRF